jgi:hypothetical protein
MRILPLVLAAMPAFALSNAITLQEQSASTQTNRVITIPRYFADKEICQNPRPYSGGSAVAFWQSDVKTRWPADAACVGGYAKLSLVTVEIPSLTGSGTVSVEFRSDPASSSSGSGLTKTQMLAFDAGGGASSWGAVMTASVVGLTGSASARTMIGNGQYKVLESGPLRTSILVREGPDSIQGTATRATSFGFQCTVNCVAPYDTSTWTTGTGSYQSMRPSFIVTFYSPHTGTGYIETDYVLDNGWLDRAQDQRLESIVLYNDAAESNACYTAPATFVIPFRSRFFETCWTNQPGAVNIDFNRAYVEYTKVIPGYGLNLVIGSQSKTLEYTSSCGISCGWNSSDQGATTSTTISPSMGTGMDVDIGGATGGGNPTLGFLPRWDAKYIVSDFDATLMVVGLGNAKAYFHAPLFMLENNTSAVYLTGRTEKAFGRLVSADVRSTYQESNGNGTAAAEAPHSPHGDVVCGNGAGGCPVGAIVCAAPNCMVTCKVGSINFCSVYGTNTINKWSQDQAHMRGEGIAAFLFTGKVVYAELVQALATFGMMATKNAGDPPTSTYSRYGNRGMIYNDGNATRSTAWPIRNLGAATLFSPDGSIEQAYFLSKLNNNLEHNEGRFNITNGWFPPANPSCAGFNKATETVIWRMGRCYDENDRLNPLAVTVEPDPGLGATCFGCDMSKASSAVSPWMEQYWTVMFAQLRDWGFKADYIHALAAKRTMALFSDSGLIGIGPAEGIKYHIPALSGTAQTGGRTGYFQTWSDVRAAFLRQTDLLKDVDNVTTSFPVFAWLNDRNSMVNTDNLTSTYWKIDNEIVKMTAIAAVVKNITAVDTVNDRVTATAHGLTDGQQAMLVATVPDTGLSGNSRCMWTSSGQNNDCHFWIHVIDANTVEFHNNAALTSKVDLKGGGSGLAIYHGNWTVVRGVSGTTAANHSNNAAVLYWPIIVGPSRTGTPDNHGWFYISGLSTAVDHDYTIADSITGKTITARRVLESLQQGMYLYERNGGNTDCTAKGIGITTCDDPRWGIQPRPLVRNVRVVPMSTSAKLYYTAPDGNACRVGVSTSAFSSTDDSTDASDAQNNPARSFPAAGLSSGTMYYYRITCGPLGGAARISGLFTTK